MFKSYDLNSWYFLLSQQDQTVPDLFSKETKYSREIVKEMYLSSFWTQLCLMLILSTVWRLDVPSCTIAVQWLTLTNVVQAGSKLRHEPSSGCLQRHENVKRLLCSLILHLCTSHSEVSLMSITVLDGTVFSTHFV